MMKILLAANMSLFGVSPQMLTSLCLFSIGAVHKVCHAIFGQFLPPPSVTLCHTSRDPQSTSHISDPRFLVGLVQKTRTKAPCTNSVSIV